MQAPDRAEFARILTAMAQVHGRTLTTEQLEVYWLALEPLSTDAFRTLAGRLMREHEFMPKPADWFRLAKAEAGGGWSSAWEEVIHNHGETADPIGQRALRALGGWRVVGFANTDRLPWLAERFREHYESGAESVDVVTRIEHAGRARLAGPAPLRKLLGVS